MMEYERLSVEELLLKAEQLEQLGMLNEALEVLRIASHREPDPIVLCEYGSLATKLERWSDAEDALKTAASLAPELPNPLTLLGLLYFELDMLEVASSYLKQSLEIERTASVFTTLAAVQLELGLFEDARTSLDYAIRIDQNYEEAYYNLGLTYKDTDPTKAIKSFEKATELDPEYSLAHRELGWLLSCQDKNAEAEYHLNRAVELDEMDGWSHIYLGNILWKRGDLISAEKAFKNAVDVWQDSAVPYWCLAQFYEYQGRTVDAQKYYELGLNVNPDDPQANRLFGNYLTKIGEAAKARPYLDRAANP